MGLIHVSGEVLGPTHERKEVMFLVDSGAGYSLLPQEVWQELGLKPMRRITVVLADGTKLQRDLSECKMSVQGIEGTSPVILGEPGDEPLLGAVTLETLGFVLNPFSRTIQPMQVRL